MLHPSDSNCWSTKTKLRKMFSHLQFPVSQQFSLPLPVFDLEDLEANSHWFRQPPWRASFCCSTQVCSEPFNRPQREMAAALALERLAQLVARVASDFQSQPLQKQYEPFLTPRAA